MILKEKLLELNRRGLVHAPDESDEAFFDRCAQFGLGSSQHFPLAKELFDIEPDWVDMSFDNKGLRFWEAGCTWTRGTQATLQLKKVFENKKSYLGYRRDEVIAHELVHVVRAGFEEPIFEEILAYHSSSSKLRRFFAPIFRSSGESLFFVAAITMLCLLNLFSFFHLAALAGFFALVSSWLVRLLWAQLIFRRSRKKMAKIVGKKLALAVLLRLTDREIIRFSKMDPEGIKQYAKKMAKIQMRWQQISGAYFDRGTL